MTQMMAAHKPIETVPTAFKWTHNSNRSTGEGISTGSSSSSTSEVYLTGSFNNWQGKILMYKQEDGEFALIIDIPPGIHHYKYIVDGEWRLDEDAPTVIHNSVDNNIVEVKRPVFEYTPASYADSDDEEGNGGGNGSGNDISNNNSGSSTNVSEAAKRATAPYSQRAPLSTDYVQEPPPMPPFLSSSQVALNHTSSQDPTWLPIPQHVMINHLYVLEASNSGNNNSGNNGGNNSSHHKVFVTGITQRFKPNKQTRITHKYVTTVFYAPTMTSMPMQPQQQQQQQQHHY